MKKRILVVDDDADIIDMIELVLRNEFEILTASDGFQAIKILETAKPELVITDLSMPNFNGLDFIRKIREIHANIPILAISGQEQKLLDRAKKFGANETVVKPFEVKIIVGKIQQLLKLAKDSKGSSAL